MKPGESAGKAARSGRRKASEAKPAPRKVSVRGKMFPRILCPLDFSAPSREALKEACRLARHFSSRLYLLHVVTTIHLVEPIPTSPDFNFVAYQKELLRAGRKKMTETAAVEVPENLDVKQIVSSGVVADEILAVAHKEKVSLIVIATHGHTGWRHLVFGSVTEKIMRQATCPVLTIRPPNPEKS